MKTHEFDYRVLSKNKIMFSSDFKNRLKEFFLQKRTVISVYVLLALISGIKQFLIGKINNYLIFKFVFWHSLWQKPLYERSFTEYLDSNHYGPFFSLIIAPFALLPDGFGMVLWNLANTGLFLFGVLTLNLPQKYRILILWICAHECLTSLLSFQFNVGISGLILLSFTYMEKKKSFLAALMMIVGFLVKLYGIVALAFFLFNKKKLSFIAYSIMLFVILFWLPALISSPAFVVKSYQDWFASLLYKSVDNTININADISFLGFIRKTFGIYINVLYGCAMAGLLLLLALFKFKMHQFLTYRLFILAYVLLCLVLFNTNVESATYIIGFLGIAIWFLLVKKSSYTIFLFVFALILTSLSPSDIFPRYIRETYVIPYALKALPCILIWMDLTYRLLFMTFDFNKEIETVND